MDARQAVDTMVVYLGQNGLKMTAQRRTVTEVFYHPEVRGTHPTVEELYLKVREADTRIGYATVYRTLKLLTDCGLASARRFGDNQTRYEPASPDDHHDHLVCSDCGHIIEFEDDDIEKLQDLVAARFGYTLTDHKMVLFGKPINGNCEITCKPKA